MKLLLCFSYRDVIQDLAIKKCSLSNKLCLQDLNWKPELYEEELLLVGAKSRFS